MNGPEVLEFCARFGDPSPKPAAAFRSSPTAEPAKSADRYATANRENGEATRAAPPRSSKRRSRSRLEPPSGTTIETIGGLLRVSPDELQRARRLFSLLGDPGRRTILERLARRPQRPGSALPEITGMNGADIYHRLRCLRWGRVLVKDRHYIYHVDPTSLECARKYVDTLIVAAARSQGVSQ